jgi:glycosyltransferase involved in cell wall biosynthesis
VINRRETPDFLVAAGVPRDKLVYAPAFYIDLKKFAPREIPKEHDLIFVGRLARNKGVDLFLDVVRASRCTAAIVGEGPLVAHAKDRVRREGLKVHFYGFAPDAAAVADSINRSRVLLMTSFNEGGPRVVLEAMACGVPVVATPVGIVPDVLPPECIEGWDSHDMSTKVQNLLMDSVLYARVREAGIFTAQQFERTAVIAQYADAIKRVTHTL